MTDGRQGRLHAGHGLHLRTSPEGYQSGRIAGPTMDFHLTDGAIAPAALVFHGERDLPVILDGIGEMRAHFDRVGLANQFVHVAGADHFYQRTATVLRADGSA